MALTSRSGRIARDGQGLASQLERLKVSGTPVESLPCDVGHWQEALAMLHGMRSAASTSQGVLHAAGVLRDGLLKGMTRAAFQMVASPKAFGAWHVHCVSSPTPLEALMAYSSIASAFGNVGQANYAAGNASLDSFALARSASGLAASSLQLPLVKDAGMGAATFDAKQMTYRGMNAMSLDQYAACVAMQLAAARGGFGCGAHAPLPARGLLQNVPSATQPLFIELVAARPSAAQVAAASATVGPTVTSPLGTELLAMAPSKREGHVEGLIVAAVKDLAGSADVSATTPLMDAGIDSLAATELAGRLRDLSGVEITGTAMFDHPTPRALASHMVEHLVGTQVAAPQGSGQGTAAAAAQLSVQAVTTLWPAGCATSSRVSMLLDASGDAVGAVPAARWSLAGHAGRLGDAQASAAQHGAFVSGADRFDNRAFSIAPAEARTMDPQQRALLEIGYVALHGSGLRSERLLGAAVGYFLGIERPDWAMKGALTPDVKVTAYTVTADTISVACGRVSFALGLHGPCMSIDTACASGLTAMHSAGLAVRGGECGVGLASAVSLKLMPQPTLAAATVGMLSMDGRCKTLDARANGYARAEGVGALAVGTSAEGEAPSTALGGSAVRQDGRSASLTAPNGSAQRLVLLGALDPVTCTAQSVDGVELHGTGTPLGDPTELGALVGVYRSGRSAPLAVGAAKGNVGHSEPVSGLLGLAKVVLQQRSLAWRGNAQLRAVNPLVVERLGAQPATYALPTQSADAAAGARRTGLSAFGYSGTISHAVLDATPASKASSLVGTAYAAPSRFVHARFSWVSRQPPKPRFGELSVTDGDIKWEHTLDEVELVFLRSHRVGLVSLLPGTCYIEFARNVAVAAHGLVPYTLGRIAFEVGWQPRRHAA